MEFFSNRVRNMLNLKKLKKYKGWLKVRARSIEVFTIPTLILFGFLVRLFMSFTTVIRAMLLSYGVMDGFASNYLYKNERFFPYQFLRYARVVANVSGIANPIIPIVWNISDGLFSVITYKKAALLEYVPRYARIVNGGLLAIFSF